MGRTGLPGVTAGYGYAASLQKQTLPPSSSNIYSPESGVGASALGFKNVDLARGIFKCTCLCVLKT